MIWLVNTFFHYFLKFLRIFEIGIAQLKNYDCTAMHVAHKKSVCFVGQSDGVIYGSKGI